WHDNWNPEPGSDPNDRYTVVTYTINTGNYAESVRLESMCFEGHRPSPWYDPSFRSSGLVIHGSGDGCIVDDILANGHTDFGIEVRGTTPLEMRYASVFNNNRAGIGLLGTALASIKIGTVSGDDNPYMVEMVGGQYGDPGGNVA